MKKKVFSAKKIDGLLPASMSSNDRQVLLQIAQKSIAAQDAGNNVVALEGAKIWAAAMKRNNNDGTSPFESCGDKCQHHLDAGDAAKYGVCYWACVLRGGVKIVPTNSVLSASIKSKAKKFLKAS